jgi:hypothetical protein
MMEQINGIYAWKKRKYGIPAAFLLHSSFFPAIVCGTGQGRGSGIWWFFCFFL